MTSGRVGPRLRVAEPSGHVEQEWLCRCHAAQVGFQRAEAFFAKGLSPAGPEAVEDACRQSQAVCAAIGESYDLAPCVARIRAAFHVAKALKRVDRFAGCLFGDSKPAAKIRGGCAVRADRLEDVAVHRPDVGVSLACELIVEVVDENAEGKEQPQRQLKARGVT